MAGPIMRQEVGNRYGRLYVVAEAGYRSRARYMHCRCDCGTEKEISLHNLRRGNTQSCGCLRVAMLLERSLRHGGYRTPTYRNWKAMNARCRNPRNKAYSRYGGAGVGVCPEWAASYETFLADMGARPSPQHTLERVDNSRGYERNNVVWATRVEHARNSRGRRLIAYRGKTMCLAAWGEEVGIPPSVLGKRLGKGWAVQRAFTQPVKRPS